MLVTFCAVKWTEWYAAENCHLAIIQIVGCLSVGRIGDQRVSLRRIHWDIGA